MRRTWAPEHPIAAVRRLTRPVSWQPARRGLAAVAAALWLVAAASPSAQGQTFKVLYSFAGSPTDGSIPSAGLLMGDSGNLYGTTMWGGKYSACPPGGVGCGTVFKLDTNGVETVLHNFAGPDGANPVANLIMDANGDLYGTTGAGGILQYCKTLNYAGCGVVFKLSGTKETVLHRFTAGDDGAQPVAGVIMDKSGALYGTAYEDGPIGPGVVFKLVGKKLTVLHAFSGGEDGGFPTGGLLLGAGGVLYGTASSGGDSNCDGYTCGVAFKLAGKRETVLHAFQGSPDGEEPSAALTADAAGNLYSTTYYGGGDYNCGTVFELTAGDKERVLYRFDDAPDGSAPFAGDGCGAFAGVVLDRQGNLYGTTLDGGLNHADAGVVYEITSDGKEKILHRFCSWKDCSDGVGPNGLIIDAQGNLYGTTSQGGTSFNGVIFELTP